MNESFQKKEQQERVERLQKISEALKEIGFIEDQVKEKFPMRYEAAELSHGVKAVKDVVENIVNNYSERFSDVPVEDAEKALGVIQEVKIELKQEKPDFAKIDGSVSAFIKGRIDHFRETLDDRVAVLAKKRYDMAQGGQYDQLLSNGVITEKELERIKSFDNRFNRDTGQVEYFNSGDWKWDIELQASKSRQEYRKNQEDDLKREYERNGESLEYRNVTTNSESSLKPKSQTRDMLLQAELLGKMYRDTFPDGELSDLIQPDTDTLSAELEQKRQENLQKKP